MRQVWLPSLRVWARAPQGVDTLPPGLPSVAVLDSSLGTSMPDRKRRRSASPIDICSSPEPDEPGYIDLSDEPLEAAVEEEPNVQCSICAPHCSSRMTLYVKEACLPIDMVHPCRFDGGAALLCASGGWRLHACLLQGLPGGLACCQAHLPPVQGTLQLLCLALDPLLTHPPRSAAGCTTLTKTVAWLYRDESVSTCTASSQMLAMRRRLSQNLRRGSRVHLRRTLQLCQSSAMCPETLTAASW